MIDSYRTVARPASARITRKKSRFLADAFPVSSLEEAEHELAGVRRRNHDASHHCFAYRLLTNDGPLNRSEDAGEPSGSAGLPILQRLEAADLLNVLVVVTRYFGGTKLGVGGLVRAYGDAAQEVLEVGDIVERRLRVEVSIDFPIEVNSGVMATIHRHQARVVEIGYDGTPHARVALPPSGIEPFHDAIVEATGDRARIEIEG